MEMILGVAGAALLIAAFVAGVFFGKQLGKPQQLFHSEAKPSEEQAAKILNERKKLQEQQQAFQAIQMYSAEQAYGMHRSGEDSE